MTDTSAWTSPATIELLRTRRSLAPHLMTGPGPTAAELEAMLAIAARVPDHGKLAPWRFVIVEGAARDRLGAIAGDIFVTNNPGADAERVALERNRFSRAPVVVAVVSRAAQHPKIPVWEQQLSAGAVCMALTTAAVAMGFVTAWLTEWMAYDRAFMTAFGLAETEVVAGFVHIGRGERPEDRVRPVMADIVTRWA
ncbi:nitroreductase [uncultured Alsobacter sp.]|uniref:nitroreductase family protein n=1 Tax=uncultured Alsobacter sp. TaxID=1748258 RepID=UPI0025E2F86F|nr:nitroreductase [uncultured Alsobacter sp.]